MAASNLISSYSDLSDLTSSLACDAFVLVPPSDLNKPVAGGCGASTPCKILTYFFQASKEVDEELAWLFGFLRLQLSSLRFFGSILLLCEDTFHGIRLLLCTIAHFVRLQVNNHCPLSTTPTTLSLQRSPGWKGQDVDPKQFVASHSL